MQLTPLGAISLLIINALAALMVGLWVFDPSESLKYIRYTGYWCMLLTIAVFLWASGLVYKKYPFFKFKWRKRSLWVAAAIIGATAFLQVHAPTGFTILMDEPVLASTAYSMHLDRQVLTPTRAQSIHGVYCLLDGYVDKRPLLFPFLVSLMHDFLGYAYSNPFVLNGALAVLYLLLVFRFGKKLGGLGAGLTAILGAISLPLLGQVSTGGGFELLNLVMILVVMHCCVVYYEFRRPELLSLLCLSLVLLAQVRYESVIFIVPVALIICLVWVRERAVQTSWGIWAAPWLLVPYLWQHRVFSDDPNLWQLFSKPECVHPFSIKYMANNMRHALLFFFDPNWELGNTPWVALVGTVAMVSFAIILLSRAARWNLFDMPPVCVVLGIFMIGFSLLFALLMAYYWGQLDDYLVSRLSLPLYIPLIFAPIALAYVFLKSRIWPALLGASLGISFFCSTLPSVSAWVYARSYLPSREPIFIGKFVDKLEGKPCIFLCDSPLIAILHEQNALSFSHALSNKAKLAQFIHGPAALPIYVFEVLEYEPARNEFIPRSINPLDSAFVLQPLEELRVSCICKYRMSLLKDIQGVELAEEIWPLERKSFERAWVSRLP